MLRQAISGFLSFLLAYAVAVTVTEMDVVAIPLGLLAATVAVMCVRREQRVDDAGSVLLGLHAFAENVDPVPATDPTLTNDIHDGVMRCIERGPSEFGMESFEKFRTNWLHRDDISPRHNPAVLRDGQALYLLHRDDIDPGNANAEDVMSTLATGYGMGYGIGLAEAHDSMHLGDQVALQWQEVIGLLASVLWGQPPSGAQIVPLAYVVDAVACGFYRDGQDMRQSASGRRSP